MRVQEKKKKNCMRVQEKKGKKIMSIVTDRRPREESNPDFTRDTGE